MGGASGLQRLDGDGTAGVAADVETEAAGASAATAQRHRPTRLLRTSTRRRRSTTHDNESVASPGATPEYHVWGGGLEPRAWRAREREPITGDCRGQKPGQEVRGFAP